MEIQQLPASLILLPATEAKVGSIMKCIKRPPFYNKNIDPDIGGLIINRNRYVTSENEYWQPQNLYVVTKDKIERDDWCIHEDFVTKVKTVVRNVYGPLGSVIGRDTYLANTCRRIIATTDKKVVTADINQCDGCMGGIPFQKDTFIHKDPDSSDMGFACTSYLYIKNYPTLESEFLKQYCEEPITNMNVDYVEIDGVLTLRVNPENNAIYIDNVEKEKLYTKEEVNALIEDFVMETHHIPTNKHPERENAVNAWRKKHNL